MGDSTVAMPIFQIKFILLKGTCKSRVMRLTTQGAELAVSVLFTCNLLFTYFTLEAICYKCDFVCINSSVKMPRLTALKTLFNSLILDLHLYDLN